MQTLELDEEAFERTFVSPMRDVTTDAEPLLDVWPYVEAIPVAERSATGPLGDVEYVYRSGDDKYHHVLIGTNFENVYLVVVVALEAGAIWGHHVLDLGERYGLNRTSVAQLADAEAEAVCADYAVTPEPPALSSTLGIALATLGLQPLNGMRSRAENGTCGWYVWGGELSQEAEFFQPLHVSHVPEECPEILPFLSLPPGWRFLIARDSTADVWFDEKLLET